MTAAARSVVIPNRQGLHARPIALITELASRFEADLTVGVDGQEVDGRSILQLMTLCASQGAELHLSARGADAEALVSALAEVIEGGFGEL